MFGKIIEGKGIGKKFLQMEKYAEQFFEKLGFRPFAGTMNLEVDEGELKGFLEGREKREISGFEEKGESFGGVTCYKVKVGGVPAALVFPEKSDHAGNVVEVISFVNLRERLKLNSGDKIQLV